MRDMHNKQNETHLTHAVGKDATLDGCRVRWAIIPDRSNKVTVLGGAGWRGERMSEGKRRSEKITSTCVAVHVLTDHKEWRAAVGWPDRDPVAVAAAVLGNDAAR